MKCINCKNKCDAKHVWGCRFPEQKELRCKDLFPVTAYPVMQSFEEWVHTNIDKSIEFCNDCPIDSKDCVVACPFRDCNFIHETDFENWKKTLFEKLDSMLYISGPDGNRFINLTAIKKYLGVKKDE